MNNQVKPIDEWRQVDSRTLAEEIIPRYRPAVIRGYVNHWPSVQAARSGPGAICDYLRRHDNGTAVDGISVPAEYHGRLFYNHDMTGFNFAKGSASITRFCEQLRHCTTLKKPPSLAIQSALIADCLPGFLKENSLAALSPAIQPRIWFGNRFVVPAHVDESNNIACVVSGRREFTLFPPEQVANLYIGPLDFAPTGLPISIVDHRQPDFDRFPRYREAMAHALTATLEPGDAIYIPTLWWHRVESLGDYNTLVNYWWKDLPGATYPPESMFYSLYHVLLNIKSLPAAHRQAWGAMFNHYLFDDANDPAAHIPPEARGILGPLSAERARKIKELLAGLLRS
ncbi:MAG TPA: cupin-like domain-containing protein [Burkholderiaceae bacterium]|nr:cupin-like domain-containing protein [Burkholderiaceae bacterium]